MRVIQSFLKVVYIPDSVQTTPHKDSGADAGLAESKTYGARLSVNHGHRSDIKRCYLSHAGLR